MRRRPIPRLQTLDALYPGLHNHVETMFEESCSSKDIKRTVETQYGVRVGLRSLDRYKQEYWRARREPAQEISSPTASRHSKVLHDPRQCRGGDNCSGSLRRPMEFPDSRWGTTGRQRS